MAIKSKGVEKQMRAVASMNPDNFVQGGLMSDFDGIITKVRFEPWDYDGKIDHHVLSVAVTIKPEEGEAFVQHYSAGDLTAFVPSMDGENPVDLENGSGEELQGIYALMVAAATQLRSSTNWAHFLEALCACDGFDRNRLTPNVDSLEGIKAHFDRVPQKKRSGIQVNTQQADGKARNNDVLVITKVIDMNAAEAATTKTTAKTTAKAAPKAEAAVVDGGVEDTLATAILEAALTAGGTLPKSKLAAIALKSVQGTDRARAVKLASDVKWLASRDEFAFDADSATVVAG